MKEKVVEILIYIMSEIQGTKGLPDIDLGDLKNRGYTQGEINAAVTWLFEHVRGIESGSATSIHTGRGSRRILHDAERVAFSTGAQGYLIQLAELGLLNEKDMEAVIERAMVSGYDKLSIGEIRDVVAVVLFAKEGKLPGSNHSLLSNEDTVH